MNGFQRFFGHLHTVNTHRRIVRKLCFKCGLKKQGLFHDISKYSPTEFWLGVKYYTGTKSPHSGERKEYGFSYAWLHHKGRNKHHAEYWTDTTGPVEMPKEYLFEMIFDRIAACKTYLKDAYTDAAPLEYYLSHINENQFHPRTRENLCRWLEILSEYGLEKLITKMKQSLKGEYII